jgi:hypothetical protein
MQDDSFSILSETHPVQDPGPQNPITVEALDQLVDDIFAKRREIEALEEQVTALNKQKAELEGRAVGYLRALGRENYKGRSGTIGISEKWRVNLPQTDEDKQALFNWLRDRGIFDKYATVNANSLNSLFMAEWEAAKKAGDLEFALPGIGAPKLFEGLSVRKK